MNWEVFECSKKDSKKLCHFFEQLFEGSKSGFTSLSAFLSGSSVLSAFLSTQKITQGSSEPL